MGQITLQIPQSGQAFSTEGPKVASDMTALQALLNGNLDSTNLNASAAIARSQMAGGFGNLAWTPVAVDTNAADGHFYSVTAAPHTITLPTPTINATVGVINNVVSGITTIARSGGAVIGGVGVNGLTSVQLGVTQAFVVLQADGSNWFIVDGQQDTGWVNITLALNVGAVATTYTAQVRLVGDTVRTRGGLKNNTGGSITAFGTIPAGFRPADVVLFPVAATGGAALVGQIDTSGNLTTTVSVANTSSIVLDGLAYALLV